MAVKRKTPVRRKKKKPDDSPYRLPAKLGAALLGACVLVAAIVVGLSALWRGVTHMEEFMVRPGDVQIESTWVRGDAMRDAFAATDPTKLLQRECSLFDRALAARVARAYGRSPWVRYVRGVEKVFPNRLRIDLDLREPHAVVQCNEDGKIYCVDQDGVVLDPDLYHLTRERLTPLLPIVRACNTQTQPVAGKRWAELSVREGVKMLDLYRTQFSQTLKVKEIAVKRDTLDDGSALGRAWLILDTGKQIFWGRTPSMMESVTEPTTPAKTARLLAVIEQEGENIGRGKSLDLVRLLME